MAQFRPNLRGRRLVGTSLALVLLASLIPITTVSATSSLTPANASISADTGPAPGTNSFTTISGPVITEGAAGDITPGGNVVLTVTGSWAFDGSSTPGVAMTAAAGSCAVTATSPVVSTSTVTTTLAGTATTGANRCRITFSGIKVKPTTATLPNVGTITIGYAGAAAITGLTSGTTVGTLTEVAGAPSAVTWTTSPSNSSGGVAFAPNQPKVHVKDQFNNPNTATAVTLTIKPGTGNPAGALSCTTNPLSTDGSGDVQFAGCKINLASVSNYQLRATAGAAIADSASFLISVGPADHLVFSSYPAASTPTTLNPQPVVQVVDAGGNLTGGTNSITLNADHNDAQFTCTGTKTHAAVAGTATFTGCVITVVDNNYTLTATTSGLADNNVTGPAFNVTSGAASKLAICWGTATVCNTTPPSPIQSGTAFSAQPQIRVQDVNGNTVATDNTTVVTLGILAGTPASGGPGTLSCTANSVTVVAGIGTLANCKIDKAGVGYRLNASATGLTSGQTNTFNVVTGPPVKLGFVVQPPASATANAAFPQDIQVAIQDAGGNTVTTGITATVSLAIGTNPAAGTLTCTSNQVTTTNGVATFQGCRINNKGNGYTLVATAVSTAPVTTLAAATSNTFNVLAPAASITLVASRTVIVWGDDVFLTVHFAANGGGKTFAIQVSKDGVNWSTATGASALVTDAGGNATFTYGPSDNRYYRASFAGTPDLQAGFSPVVRVVVRQTNQLRPTHTGFKTISKGTQIEFKSVVRPNRPELPQPVVNFVVYQRIGSRWTKVLDRMINTDRNASSPDYGKATLFITFNTAAQFYVRSQAVPTPLNANSGWSKVELYTVG